MVNRTLGLFLLIGALMASGCGGGSAAAGETRLFGAGSTFAFPLYSHWAAEYAKSHPAVQIDYQPLGSGAGIGLVTQGRVDFGATDGPMTDADLRTFERERGCKVLHVPVALGADVPSYNIPGVTAELKFTPRALAGIFLGTITTWNDAELASANAGVALPAAAIVVVHRSDRSGTTYVWTDYLSKVSEEWRSKVGRGTAVNWPVGTSASGNQGVADTIKATPNAIGYLELTYAIREKLPYGDVQNRAGAFIKADYTTVTAAADSVASMPDDLRVSITDAAGEGAYPISTLTWLLLPDHITDQAKRSALVAFVDWGLNDGQRYAEELSYARLPAGVVDKAKSMVARIQ